MERIERVERRDDVEPVRLALLSPTERERERQERERRRRAHARQAGDPRPASESAGAHAADGSPRRLDLRA